MVRWLRQQLRQKEEEIRNERRKKPGRKVTIVHLLSTIYHCLRSTNPTSRTSTNIHIAARIKRSRKTSQTKFKVRCNRFLYTLVLKDSDKADKIKQSLPPGALQIYKQHVEDAELFFD